MIFERIKELRENKELTQRDLAKLLNISKSTYNRWEIGDVFIPLKHLNSLCNFYNVSMDYIINLTDKKNYENINSNFSKKMIGSRLLTFRKEVGLSQNKLAKILNTSHSTISAYENGKTYLLTVFAYQIVIKYNISLDWLCGRIEKKNI